MKVRLSRERPPAGERELKQLQHEMGTAAPFDYVEFLSARNGCRVETNIFRIDEGNESGVNAFLHIDQVIKQKTALGDRLSRHAWPIADAEGGNYVCLRLEGSGHWSVVFWDHEFEEEIVLNASFTGFVESLEKFDPRSVELKPGQVVSAWIDPSLLADDDN